VEQTPAAATIARNREDVPQSVKERIATFSALWHLKTSLWHLKTSNVAGGLPQLAECGTKCATYQDPSPTPNPNPNPSQSGASVEHPKGTTEEGLAKARRWALYQKLPSTRL